MFSEQKNFQWTEEFYYSSDSSGFTYGHALNTFQKDSFKLLFFLQLFCLLNPTHILNDSYQEI